MKIYGLNPKACVARDGWIVTKTEDIRKPNPCKSPKITVCN